MLLIKMQRALCLGKIILLVTYLPSSSITSEVAKRCLEPVVDFIQSKLFVWRLDYGLKKKEKP